MINLIALGLSSCFILLSTALLYANSGTTNLDSLYILTSISFVSKDNLTSLLYWYESYYIHISLLFMSVGFLFKISAAPDVWCGKLLIRAKLSNSGKLLKIFIPNFVLSGWSNYSGMVISKNMSENEMDNHGSKSANIAVKEQRVDGSYFIGKTTHKKLRCTLMGFERNYQVKILSNQINKQIRLYSSDTIINTKNKNSKLNNFWFISGLVDAEGCFTIGVSRSSKNIVGWGLKLTFKIGLHIKDKALLEQVKNTLGVGNITKDKDLLHYRVESLKDLLVIIKIFDEYSLITKKRADYLLFKQAINLVLNKEHLNMEGLTKIVSIKASMNKGINNKLKESFTNLIPVERPLVLNTSIPDPQWLSGFTSGEGCFFIVIHKSPNSKIGIAVQLKFILVQHIRDEQLMNNIKEYLDCGHLLQKRETIHYTVSNFKDLNEKILPYPLPFFY